MNRRTPENHQMHVIAATGLLFAMLVGLSFYGWVRFGSSILLTLDQTGLSWCF